MFIKEKIDEILWLLSVKYGMRITCSQLIIAIVLMISTIIFYGFIERKSSELHQVPNSDVPSEVRNLVLPEPI